MKMIYVLFALPAIMLAMGVGPVRAADTLVDAWNDTQEPGGAQAEYSGVCIGFKYIPSKDCSLTRIEFFAGGVGGHVSVSLRADTGSGLPDGSLLATTGTYAESATPGWQGRNFLTPASLTAGRTYYFTYLPVAHAEASMGVAGTLITSWGGGLECSGPWGHEDQAYWAVRFYGTLSVPAVGGTWGRVKGLYR
jgi:hypothetical protein